MQGDSATETALNATQGRLRHIEANFADVSKERGRLAAALDSATERHDHELSSQRMRFEALQARALATEKLPVGTREHLLAKAEEVLALQRGRDAVDPASQPLAASAA